MLHGTLELHDIRDVEAFVARIVDRSRLELGYHEREDLLAELVAAAWELSVEYRPGKASFRQYAGARLNWRLVEWKRNRSGRTVWKFGDGRIYERSLPQFHSLDHQPELVDAHRTVEAGPDRFPSLDGIFGTGDSRDPRRDDTLGEETDRVAA